MTPTPEPGWWTPSERFARGPDPAQSVTRAHELVAAASALDPERLAHLQAERPDALERVLFAVCAVAPYLAAHLRRRPALLFLLAEDELAEPRERAGLEADLDAALAAVTEGEDPGDVLRRFKYRELARITVREACPELVPEARVAETLGELSVLAEVLLARALAIAAARLEERAGPPVWRERGGDGPAHRLRFAVLGLGKLGGGELNYSSDVDLVYVFERAPTEAGLTGGPGDDWTPAEYFRRLALALGPLVEAVTSEGFLYRIDLELRPEGGQGALVVSDDFLQRYYDGWAATWEKAAFMKARPVAGDLDFGWAVARGVAPMIYRSSMDVAGVDAIREMKARVEAAHAREDAFDVKLGAGGIRDVEFVAQALQLLHGGRVPQVRGRSAPDTLERLAAVDLLDADAARELLTAYRFLRRVENRIQMEGERQAHVLPDEGAGRERIARALWPEEGALARLDERLAAETARVRRHFDALFASSERERVLDLLVQHAPGFAAAPQNRALTERLADDVARAIARSAEPERALNSFARFVEGVGSRSFYYGLLADRPELVERLVACFAASRFLSSILSTQPSLIEPVFDDPERLLASRAELEAGLAALREELAARPERAPEEAALAALRLFQQRELVNVGLLDLADAVSLGEVEAALTDVAEVCLAGGLDVAREQIARAQPAVAREIDAGEFLVVGMGKLGSRELSYGSDLDVIFLFDRPGAEGAQATAAQEAFVRLAQKLGWALQTRTGEGICYEVDARLRPSGNQGMLVTSIDAFARYHEESAWLWERQALLRARPVAGSRALGERFDALRRALLERPLPDDGAAEIHRIRMRMESEIAKERRGVRNLKAGRGGLLDVESIVQWIQLRTGAEGPEAAREALLERVSIDELLERIGAHGLLPADDVATLREGWAFLKRLSSQLRIVENRSIDDLREERSDLDSVARALGYPTSGRSGASRLPLLDDYHRHTTTIRHLYEVTFGDSPEK